VFFFFKVLAVERIDDDIGGRGTSSILEMLNYAVSVLRWVKKSAVF